jgi:hypothetical protein
MSPIQRQARKASGLADRLAELAGPDGFTDRGRYGDGAHDTARLAWAVLASTAAGHGSDAGPAVDALIAGQCSDGAFPEVVGAACASGEPAATSLAVQALDAALLPEHAGPVDAAADAVPASWTREHTLALGAAGTALQGLLNVAGQPFGAADDGRTTTLASVIDGRTAVGLASSRSAELLGRAQDADGGLPRRLLDRTELTRKQAKHAPGSNPRTSIDAAAALAGTSLLSHGASPLMAQVLLPLPPLPATEPAPQAAPAMVRSERPLLPWLLAALAFGLLCFSVGRLTAPRPGRSSTQPATKESNR